MYGIVITVVLTAEYKSFTVSGEITESKKVCADNVTSVMSTLYKSTMQSVIIKVHQNSDSLETRLIFMRTLE